MKHLYIFLSILMFGLSLTGQSNQPEFGSAHHHQDGPCVTEDYRNQIIARIKASKFYEAPKNNKSGASVTPYLSWPTKHTPTSLNITDPSYFGISNYVDRNLDFPDRVEDWNCGDRSYDTNWGYNHGGLDIYSYPFPWEKMIKNEVRAVAAADGFIIDKEDGNYDRNCGQLVANASRANSITIRHTNGYYSLYVHFKKNSVTSKQMGDPVITGEVLGVVGSSGNSTGPHLHFEVWDENFQIVEPFFNEQEPLCNTTTENSLWLEQRGYYQSKLNKLMITDERAQWGGCEFRDNGEVYQEADVVSFNDEFYCYLFTTDQLISDNIDVKIIRPDQSIFYQYNINCQSTPAACQYWSAAWWNFPFTIGTNEPCGEWAFQVDYAGSVHTKRFTLGDNPIVEGVEGPLEVEATSIVSYKITNPNLQSRYFWTAFSGTIVSGQDTDEIEVAWEDTDTGLLCVNEITDSGCQSTSLCNNIVIGVSSTRDLNSQNLKIIPNPFEEYIVLEELPSEAKEIKIYTHTGRLVLQKEINSAKQKIYLSHLEAGTYLLEAKGNFSSIIQKIIKL